MRTTRRAIALPTIALAAALSMTACNQEEAAPPAANPTAAPTTAPSSAAPSTESPATGAPATEAPSAEAPNGDTSAQPRSSREDAGDKSGLDAETSAIPAGPVSAITIKKLGGYGKDSGYGTFYSVLDVTSKERGLVSIEYVMLDASGKELKTVKDNFDVGGTAHEMKVTRAIGQLPPASEGKVAKVRLRIVKNDANSFATVTQIDQIQPGYDDKIKTATVSGRYKTDGKGSVVTLNAICSDAAGNVVAGNSPVDQIKAPTWTPFKVTLFDAPSGFHASRCYVGS